MKTPEDQPKKASRTRRSKGRKRSRTRTPQELPVVRPDTAGIDLAVTSDIGVAVAPDREGETVRPFSPMSHGLEALVAYLKAMRVTISSPYPSLP